MLSAFGVDHGFSKSFVPGKGFAQATETAAGHMKGWKPASKLSKPDRKKIIEQHQTTGMYRRMGMHETNEQYARSQPQVKHKLWEGHRTPMNRKVTVNRKATKLGDENPGLAGYARANGRGGGMVKVLPGQSKADAALTLKHEKAHVTPKRNIWRLHERTGASKWSEGAEEGRADYIAHGGKSPGAYANSHPEWNKGYADVQAKMHAAHQKKAKLKLKTS